MAIPDFDAAKLAAEVLKAAVSSGTVKMFGVYGNVADHHANAKADGEYLASLYKAIYEEIRKSE